MAVTLEQLARQARRRIDESGKFLGVISENIVVDYLTGTRHIEIRAETALDDITSIAEVVTIVIKEENATKLSIDSHMADTLTKFAAR